MSPTDVLRGWKLARLALKTLVRLGSVTNIKVTAELGSEKLSVTTVLQILPLCKDKS